MSSLDLKDVIRSAQKRTYQADSSGSTQDLIYLLKVAQRGDQNPIYSVDSDDALPFLLDSATSTLEKAPTIFYSKGSKNLYFAKNNEWRPLVKYTPLEWVGTNGLFAYGGGTATVIDTIDYGSFASDTSPFTNIGSMTETKSYMSAARDYSNKDASYIIGGLGGVPGAKSTIEKHANSTSSSSGSSVGNLSVTSYRNSTVASATDAYTHLSNTPTVVSAIDKFAFGSTVTGVEVGDMLAAAPTNLGITDAANQKGYFRRFSSTGIELEVFPFSTGVPFTTSLVSPYGATLPVGFATAAFSNPTQGYIGTGNEMERFNFGNDASVAYGNPTAPATTRLNGQGGGSASETKGYLTGPVASPAGNAIISLPFANDADTGVMTPGVFSPSPANPAASSGGSHF